MTNNWYAIQAKAADESADVMIYDVVGAWGVSAQQFVTDLKGLKAKTINVRLNTPGGDVFDGLAIYNALRDHPAKVVTRVDGLAASMGSVIAQAGDERRMAKNAYMMIHNPWSMAAGDAAEMRKSADLLDKVCGTLAQTYADRTGKSVDEMKAAMAETSWYTADEAKAAGLCDAVDDDNEEDTTTARASFDYRVLAAGPDRLRQFVAARIRETQQANPLTAPRGAANTVSPHEESNMDLESFKAFAAKNPDAVASLTAQAVSAAKAEMAPKPATVAELKAAFPEHSGFIVDQIGANATMAEAKAAFADVLKAEHATAVAAKDAEIARLTKVAGLVTSGAAGVSTEATPAAPAAPAAQPDGSDPKALAEWEWDNKPESRTGYSTRDRYVAIRTREISGEFRAHGDTRIKR
jgi:ATP-dependent Clp endopeptidase proteolytic subunit ClpP